MACTKIDPTTKKPLNKYLNTRIDTELARINTMSNSAVGAYHRLQLHAAQHSGIVPADEAIIKRIARCNAKDWKRNREQVLAAMEPLDGGYLIRDAATSEERYDQLVEKARAGGLAKAAAGQPLEASHKRHLSFSANPLKSLNPSLPVAGQISKSKDQTYKATPPSGAALYEDSRLEEQEEEQEGPPPLEAAAAPDDPSRLPDEVFMTGDEQEPPPEGFGCETDDASQHETISTGRNSERAPHNRRTPHEVDWRDAAKAWKDSVWYAEWGPTPNEEGCRFRSDPVTKMFFPTDAERQEAKAKHQRWLAERAATADEENAF
jgi:hypothetical protein